MAGASALGELRISAAADVRLAGPEDDADLRALLRRSVIDGAVRVAFTREPSFFAADGLAGAHDTTVVARAQRGIAGLGHVSVLSLMRNGRASRLGYLAALRVDPNTRRSPRLIRAGYELLLHETDPSAEGFFTSIADDNARARRVLEHGGRLGIPEYTPISNLVTLVAPVSKKASPLPEQSTRPDLTPFLASQSRDYQLGLAWGDHVWGALRRHGAQERDFIVVRRDGDIVACAAVWDQTSFRQTVIDGYAPALSVTRPVVNAFRALSGRPVLPEPGCVLRQGFVLGGYATHPEFWSELWPRLAERARTMGLDWLTICRDARDPECAALRRLTSAREYPTTLYAVGAQPALTWDGRLFRPEVGLL